MAGLGYRVTKRVFDIASSSAAIVATSPLWLVVAIGIKMSSEGPVFYRATRIGKDQKPFTLYKFRSMHEYRSEVKGEVCEGGYIANESRIFPFGAFLRKSKIDELPQLINVLMSQMSVIGPRPLGEVGVRKQLIGRYDEVLSVKPGLACLDSLFDYAHGELVVKDNKVFEEEVAPVRAYLASMYVKQQSIALDAYCIARTLHLIYQIVVQKKRDFPFTEYEREAIRRVFGDSAE